MKKAALVLFTGDRVEYINYTIKRCLDLIKTYDEKILVDIFLICFNELDLTHIKYDIKVLPFEKPDMYSEIIKNFPRSRQQDNGSEEVNMRISYGHYILFGAVPNVFKDNKELFNDYDYMLKCRADLIFDFDNEAIKQFNIESELLTFECFWGGCRYNKSYMNDHFNFGTTNSMLIINSFKKEDCLMRQFWNPEQYMTYLYSTANKPIRIITTDKYYLLSKDRDSRKFIGFPMERINSEDIKFLENLGINIKEIKFTNIYDR